MGAHLKVTLVHLFIEFSCTGRKSYKVQLREHSPEPCMIYLRVIFTEQKSAILQRCVHFLYPFWLVTMVMQLQVDARVFLGGC